MIAAGIGFRRGCPPDKIVEILRAALKAANISEDALTLIAIPEFKAGEAAPKRAAKMLNKKLSRIGDDAIGAAQANCITRSQTVKQKTGHYSIAEGAALAAVGAQGRLILPRIDNGVASCALAEGSAE